MEQIRLNEGENMGLFSIFKILWEEKKKAKKYAEMGFEELSVLSDDELLEALTTRMIAEEGNMEVEECLQQFKGAKRIFYVVNYFDMEVQNGGLCQFFVNSSRNVAPYILECLNTIGASQYEKMLSEFVTEHGISMDNLDSFIIDDVDEFEEQTQRYPFDDFDDAYYELYEKEPLDRMLVNYAKNNLKDFV